MFSLYICATKQTEIMQTETKRVIGEWYVANSFVEDYDTKLFTKRVKKVVGSNSEMDEDRTIAHIDGLTLNEADEIANAVSLIPKMIAEFIFISSHFENLVGKGTRELTISEREILNRANQILAKLK